VRFVGATRWTDWLLYATEFASQSWAARRKPEYAHVWKPDAHERHLAAIEAALATPHDGPTVVVTHHAPSAKSVEVTITAADAAFASDLEETVLRHRPSLWVHGHIRWHSGYVFGDTRVLANPRGYQGDEWGEKSGFRNSSSMCSELAR